MDPRPELRTRQGRRRFRRALAWGFLASLAFHAAVFLLWRGLPAADAPGGPAAASRAAEPRPTEGALRAVDLAASAAPEEIPPPSAPRLDPLAPPPEWDDASESPSLGPVSLEEPAGGPPGEGGAERGRGADRGPGSGTRGPVPRSILPQWDPPPDVRGMRVTVHVHVDAEGRPSGEVRLDPPTPDSAFNRRLVDKVRRMEYEPARRNGEPVAGWAQITFVF